MEPAVQPMVAASATASAAPGCPWPLAFMKRENFAKGDYLFRAGDKADKMFYINKGLIKLPEINKTVKAGQILGEIGIFSPSKERTASALCEEDLEAFTMGGEEVEQFFRRDPSLAINLIQLSVSRLVETIRVEAEAKERTRSELRIAHQIQTSMLPRNFPPFPERKEFEIYAMMDPAREVGGDFYDFFFVERDKLCLIVGDVSGKGVPAALFMSISKALLRSEAMRGYGPDEVLAHVNKLLCPDNPLCMFVTVFCALLNTATGELECCNAGHFAPLRCSRYGRVSELEVPKGMAVGVMEDSQFSSKRQVLRPGELIFLYTDGVTEAMDPDQQLFSDARLRTALRESRDKDVTGIIGGIRQEVANHTQKAPQSDDITMLALKYHGPGGRTS